MPIETPSTDPEQNAQWQRDAEVKALAEKMVRTVREALRHTDDPEEAGWRVYAAVSSPDERD